MILRDDIQVVGVEYEHFTFNGGEEHVALVDCPETIDKIHVLAHLGSSKTVMRLLMLCDALKREYTYIDVLEIPYFPYARQDRVCNSGEALSVKVMADLINSIGAEKVVITDPHSDVTPALINNVSVIEQHEIIPNRLLEGYTLVCPDAGAEKKIAKLGRPYIMCTKKRDVSTGDLSGFQVVSDLADISEGSKALIVDDICDGGGTFLGLSEALKSTGKFSEVNLIVTHGIFSRGFSVFKGHLNKIMWLSTHVEGNVVKRSWEVHRT